MALAAVKAFNSGAAAAYSLLVAFLAQVFLGKVGARASCEKKV